MANVYFEFQQVGSYIKVIALDEKTGEEVSIVGDPKVSQKELEALAHKKLMKKLGLKKV